MVLTSHRRQAHHEARAKNPGAFVLRYAHAVLGANPPAVRFDDLARDGKTEPGVLPKALVGPVGVEALEDALHRLGRDAGAIVIDRDLDRTAQPPRGDANPAVRRRERARVLDQVIDDLPKPRVVPRHNERTRRTSLE